VQAARPAPPHRSVPDKLVVLSFDDAVSTQATVAAPMVKKYGFGATFFICEFPPDFVDKHKYMSWRQIQQLNAMGFEIGSHTRTHTHVTALTAPQFADELRYIEQKCGRYGIPRPRSFAYPAYVTSPMALQVLRQRGYRFARAGGGRAFDPVRDDALLIPSFSTTGDDPQRVLNDLQQAHDGRIVVLTIHGTPDVAHPPVTTPSALLARYLRYLHDHHYHVIAMRDLARYVPSRAPDGAASGSKSHAP